MLVQTQATVQEYCWNQKAECVSEGVLCSVMLLPRAAFLTCETEVCFETRSTQCTGQVKAIMEKYVLYWNMKIILRYKYRGLIKVSKVTQNSA